MVRVQYMFDTLNWRLI